MKYLTGGLASLTGHDVRQRKVFAYTLAKSAGDAAAIRIVVSQERIHGVAHASLPLNAIDELTATKKLGNVIKPGGRGYAAGKTEKHKRNRD